ncbi:MAG: InlB B-repeat-containing protein [Ruminococcus sp.]|nr:InlB B-repeat-containing protein [Ruminococcus sp.]
MKRISTITCLLIVLLVACLITPVMTIAAKNNDTIQAKNPIIGDVDGDGTVTIIDATYIQRHLASIPIPFEINDKVADTDGDGNVTIIDATMIQRYLASLPYEGKIGEEIELPTEEPTVTPTESQSDIPTEIPTSESTNPKFVVNSVNAKPGDKNVAVTVSVKNNPGIAAIALDINYDKNSLKLTGFDYNTSALMGASTTPYSATAKIPCLFMVNGTQNITGDFTFATLYFDVLESAVGECPITVTYDEDNVYNIAENNVQFDIVSGAIKTPGQRPTEPQTTMFTVTFKDYDGKVLSTQTVEKGKNATAPASPSREGFAFAGWSVSFENVQKDLTVTATYTELGKTPSFVIEKVNAKPGQKNVAVTVAVKNNPGVSAIALDVMFDNSKLTLTGFTYNDSALSGASTTPYSASASTPCLYMVNGTKDITDDFTFATLYFDIPATANGTYPISVVYDSDNVYNLAEDNIAFDVINGSITVS